MLSYLRFFLSSTGRWNKDGKRVFVQVSAPSNELLTCLANNFMI